MVVTSILESGLDAAAGEDFDLFVRASRFAAYQQSRAWASAVPRVRGRDHLYFLCREGDAAIGAAVIRRTRLGPWAWLATVQRGPVVHDAGRLDRVVTALREALAASGCCSLQLAPRIAGRDLPAAIDALRRQGFVPLAAHRQPLHVATGIVALDRPEAAILAGFKQRGRRQLKLAAQAGITVRAAASDGDFAAYQTVLDEFRASRPDYDMHGLPDAAGQAALIASCGGGMLLAERDGKVIGGHAFVRQGDEAIWLSLASSADDPAIPRAYPLLWHAMLGARAMGCTGYDLAGLPVGESRDAGEAARMQFKTAFAPSRRIMPAMQVVALKPLRHLVFFGARQAYRGSRRGRPPTARAVGAVQGRLDAGA